MNERLRDLVGWARDAPRRTQSVSVGVYVDRDLMGFRVERFKGWLRIDLGIEFGG
jgi:hypothetical protein